MHNPLTVYKTVHDYAIYLVYYIDYNGLGHDLVYNKYFDGFYDRRTGQVVTSDEF